MSTGTVTILTKIFRGFPKCFQAYVGKVLEIRPRPLLSTFSKYITYQSSHHFDAIYAGLPTESLNRQLIHTCTYIIRLVVESDFNTIKTLPICSYNDAENHRLRKFLFATVIMNGIMKGL